MRNLVLLLWAAVAAQLVMADQGALEQMKARASVCRAALEADSGEKVQFNELTKKWMKYLVLPPKVTFDVTTTNSLVTPFKGVIVVEQSTTGLPFDLESDARAAAIDSDDISMRVTTRLEFGYQSDQWVFMGAEWSMALRNKRGRAYENLDTRQIKKDEWLKLYESKPLGKCAA